ncbi:MAG TPA: hypothetical protein VHO25_01330 [Polyangiaceae bacterium]|nr:hypothetical protein [Polyangiaceae bacterium]
MEALERVLVALMLAPLALVAHRVEPLALILGASRMVALVVKREARAVVALPARTLEDLAEQVE